MYLNKSKKHILFFEPRIEGHHLMWLRVLCDSFLKAGYKLTIAIDGRNDIAKKRIQANGEASLANYKFISVYDSKGNLRGGSKIKALAACLKESQADEAFCNSLDEFASNISRKAFFGLKPPKILKGKISGIYYRPRQLDKNQRNFCNYIKRSGFKNLIKKGWFKNIYFLDEFLAKELNQKSSYHYLTLPDFWHGTYTHSKHDARSKLNMPSDKRVFLFYGTDSKRKGLHLLLEAIENITDLSNFFLLIAGEAGMNSMLTERLKTLEAKGHAKLLNYYISEEEEKLCFSAADFIVMPYINHYGSSGILAQASAAKRPVIASDYHLLGSRTQRYQLGLTFTNNELESLKKTLLQALSLNDCNLDAYTATLESFSKLCSEEALRTELYKAYPVLMEN